MDIATLRNTGEPRAISEAAVVARWPRWLVLGSLVLSLSAGCAVQLAYDNVDRLVRWFAADFVSMDRAQRVNFDTGVAEVIAWHRSAHLPSYASFFEAVRASLADGTDPEEIEAIVNTVVAWALEIEQRALPVAVDLLASLSVAQTAELRRRLRESNDELAAEERTQTLEQSREAWQKETARRFSRFSGRLTAAQTTYLASQSTRYLPDTVLWAEYRARWQEDLLQLLAPDADRAGFDAGFRALVAARDRYYGAELDRVWDNNRRLSVEVTAWLINHLTPEQRARFDARLVSLAADFRALADPAAPPATEDFCRLLVC